MEYHISKYNDYLAERCITVLKHIWKKILAVAVITVLLAGNGMGYITYADDSETTAFTDEELAFIAASDTFKLGYVRDRKPVSFADNNGELAGISRSIFDRISAISGLKFEYVELPDGEVTYDYLMEEGFDLVTGVEYNEENQKAKGILMSDPYLSSRKVVVTKKSLNFDANGHYTVAISTGSQTIRKVFANHYPNFELVDYPSIEDCLTAVNNEEVDLMVQNQYVVEYWLYKPIYEDLTVIPVVELNDLLCFSAVYPFENIDNEDYAQKELLISIINKSIAQISDSEISGYIIDATMDNMYKHTFADVLYQYRFTFILLGIALVFIIVLLYANLHIRVRAINARADAKAKSQFLSTMSHEIRTPLNGLLSLNYLMTQHLDDREKTENYLKQSSSMAQYLLSLVNNILDMSKLQESSMELEHKPVNLELLLETVELIEKSVMEDKQIDFQMDVNLTCSNIIGDAVRIQQVLINIIDNARKYTPNGGKVSVKVRQIIHANDEVMTKAEITDNGRGMDEEFQKKIFDPFTQESNAVSQGNQGTGLGMAICALLAERMGGCLSVESKLGKGSRFTFLFVSKPAPEESEDPLTDSETLTNASAPTHPLHILVVEDNELNGQILSEVLTESGFQVKHVLNGKEAVSAFSASAPYEYDVILMDILMPEMDGFEATRAIRSLNRPDADTVKIFACTANSFKADYDKAMENGMDDFIAKPIKIEELLKKLEQSNSDPDAGNAPDIP